MQKILTTQPPPSYEQSQGLVQPAAGDQPSSNSEQFEKVGEIANAPVYVQNPGFIENPPHNPGYPAQNSGYPAQNPGYPAQNPGYPAQNPGYPAPNSGYPQQNAGYPPQNTGYLAQNVVYPPRNPIFVAPEMSTRTFVNFTGAPVTIAIGPLGPYPASITCPRCNKAVISETKVSPNFLAWMSCAALMFVGCFFGCCLLPFCMTPCQDVEHFCPECKIYLGKYSRMDYSTSSYSRRRWRRY